MGIATLQYGNKIQSGYWQLHSEKRVGVSQTAIAKPATVEKCIPGAKADNTEYNLKLLAKDNHQIVIYVCGNDTRLGQLEVTNINNCCVHLQKQCYNLVLSGTLPNLTCSDLFSRM